MIFPFASIFNDSARQIKLSNHINEFQQWHWTCRHVKESFNYIIYLIDKYLIPFNMVKSFTLIPHISKGSMQHQAYSLVLFYLSFSKLVFKEVIERAWLVGDLGAGPRQMRGYLNPPLSLDYTVLPSSPQQSLFQGQSFERTMCFWNHLNGIHDWTQLRPL